jgi:hypothetical protein
MLENTSYLQIRKNSIVQYDQSEFSKRKQEAVLELLSENGKDTYRGEMSIVAQKNLRRKIQIWHSGIEYFNSKVYNPNSFNTKRLVFLTLTLSASQRHSDQQIKKDILKPYMRVLREKFNCENYVWKAESQANGSIHFHIIIDRYIDKNELQCLWNYCQQKLFYIDRFEQKFKHRNPPSTHVEVVDNLEVAEKYIEKYICKEDKYRRIEGAIWKASKSVNSLKFFEIVEDSQIKESINQAIENKDCSIVEKENYRMFFFEKDKLISYLPKYHKFQYFNYLQFLIDYLFKDNCDQMFSEYCICRKNVFDNRNKAKEYEHVFSRKQENITQTSLFKDIVFQKDNSSSAIRKHREL